MPSASPAASVTLSAIVAVYCVLTLRAAVGVNIAVLPLTFTVPVTVAPPALGCRVKLAVLSVELVIASENVADTEVFVATPVVPLAGEVADTVGGVVSGATAVVNCQVKSVPSALPAASVTLSAMVAV